MIILQQERKVQLKITMQQVHHQMQTQTQALKTQVGLTMFKRLIPMVNIVQE